jgi:hypothetical protein
LLPGIDRHKTATVAEQLRRAVENQTDGNGSSQKITVSLGSASAAASARNSLRRRRRHVLGQVAGRTASATGAGSSQRNRGALLTPPTVPSRPLTSSPPSSALTPDSPPYGALLWRPQARRESASPTGEPPSSPRLLLTTSARSPFPTSPLQARSAQRESGHR